jgi:hypothetical protein
MSSTYDPTDIRTQERAAADADTRKQLSKDTEESDFRWLMGSKRGRRIVWRQLDQAGVFRPVFNTNSMAMSFAEGVRNSGLRTLSQIHALCPELYSVMLKEHVHDNRNNDDD